MSRGRRGPCFPRWKVLQGRRKGRSSAGRGCSRAGSRPLQLTGKSFSDFWRREHRPLNVLYSREGSVYDKFADAADFMAHATCPADAGGCALQTNVQPPESLDTHELVHAYLYPTGYPPWVLIEGAAVALSCTSRFYATSKPAMTWDQLASVQSGAIDPVSAHSAGAWLASYLLDQFGAAPFLETCRSVSHDASAADMTAAFQRIYGASLATLWASAWSEDQPRNTGLWQCSRPPMALDNTAVDSDGTCGPDITRPFTLASEVTISFTTTSADISLGPCGPVTVPDGGLNGALPGGLLALYHLPS